jgi:hypothetical protein
MNLAMRAGLQDTCQCVLVCKSDRATKIAAALQTLSEVPPSDPSTFREPVTYRLPGKSS